MSDLNSINISGNICADPELRHLESGMAVCTLRLASNQKRKDANGNVHEDTCFVDVTVWGNSAEAAAKYLTKGSGVLVSGRLRYETWETDGQKRSRHTINCQAWSFPPGKRQDSDGGGQGGNEPAATGQTSGAAGEDEMPF